MRKRTIGIIYVILGIYFSIVNGMLSILFLLFSSTGFYYPLTSLEFWKQWCLSGGWTVIPFAGFGVYLLLIGYRNYKSRSPS